MQDRGLKTLNHTLQKLDREKVQAKLSIQARVAFWNFALISRGHIAGNVTRAHGTTMACRVKSRGHMAPQWYAGVLSSHVPWPESNSPAFPSPPTPFLILSRCCDILIVAYLNRSRINFEWEYTATCRLGLERNMLGLRLGLGRRITAGLRLWG